MRTTLLLSLLALSFCGPGCSADLHWYKGNTHTHSFWSDGNDFPEMIALWYRERGYDFLVLSDHNVLSQGERWMKVTEVDRRSGGQALPKYLAKLPDAVKLRGEGESREVRLAPLPDIRKIAQTDRFIMIQGEEISDAFEKRPIHINAFNLGELVPPQGGSSLRETMRRNLLAVDEQAKRLGQPTLPHLNHPNFGWAITAEDIAHVVEEEFFEVYNGHPSVGHTGDEYHAPVERMWDIANTLRIAELHAPPLYGVATDDSHHYHDGPKQTVTPGKGWIMVHAAGRDPASLIRAMRDGEFYASSGVTLSDIQYDGKMLTVEVADPGDAQYTIEFIGTLRGYDATVESRKDRNGNEVTGAYSPDVGRVLMTANGTGAAYVLRGDELYVRARVRSNRPPANPSYPGQLAEAWTQPVGWEKHLDPEVVRQHFHR